MLLKQNLSLYRVLKITWKIDILMLALCTIAFFIDTKILPDVHLLPALPTLIGTAVAFFIAFNNNQAYGRWWEGRAIWGGIVNDSRSWARSLLVYTTDGYLARKMIVRHIAFLYALKADLRKTTDEEYKKFLSPADIHHLDGFSNIPNAILDLQSTDLQLLFDQHKIDGFHFLALNELVRGFCDGMGKSERIRNTVFPTTYIFFTRLFIWILVILTTMTLSESVGPWSIFFAWVIGFVFHSSHIIGMSIMNPFELKPESLPLDSITRTIEINLLQAMGESEVPGAVAALHDGEYLL